MEKIKKLSEKQIELLKKPLPKEALKQHPTKSYLTSIKNIYVSERLNEVFGVGSWNIRGVLMEKVGKMVVVEATLTIPEYGMSFTHFGGNDNTDLGDAYKGALSDALTKIAATYLYVGIDVFKGLGFEAEVAKIPFQKKHLDQLVKMYNSEENRYSYNNICEWLKTHDISDKMKEEISSIDFKLQVW